MAVNLSPVGGVAAQFFDNNGVILSGGKIYTYSAGTTTNAATYTSSAGTTAHTNPIILDSAGRVPSGEIWLTDGTQYKFVIKNASDVLIGTYDNIVGINSNFVNFTASEEIQTATAGQTVFTLATMQYVPGANNLSVFVDGVNQYDGSTYAYVETSSTVVTFTDGLHVGALVKFTTAATLSTGVTDASLVTYNPPFVDAVPATVEDKLAQTVSVKDFGATGDGVTDDSTAIQAAEDEASTSGLAVRFPAGTYLCESAVYRKGNTDWIGDGMYLSVLKHSGGADTHNLVYIEDPDVSYDNIGFYNMGFDGNRSGSDDDSADRIVVFLDRNSDGGVDSPASDARFIGCRLFNFSYGGFGLHVKGYTGVQVKDSIFEDGGSGIYHPVYLRRCADVSVIGNNSTGRDGNACIKVQSSPQSVIANNICQDGAKGIQAQDAQSVTITGNTIYNATLFGIDSTIELLSASNDVTVSGNTVYNSAGGIRLSNITVFSASGNNISGFSTDGINCRAARDGSVSGNTLFTADAGGGTVKFISLEAGPTTNRMSISSNTLRTSRASGTTYGIWTDETTVSGIDLTVNAFSGTTWTQKHLGIEPVLYADPATGIAVGYDSRVFSTSLQEVHGTANVSGFPSYAAVNWRNADVAPAVVLGKSRSGTIGTNSSTVVSGDVLGSVIFYGDTNSSFLRGAQIDVAVDGTPSSDMPATISVRTTPVGSSTPVARNKFKSNGSFNYVPMTQPSTAVAGDTYYDSGTNKLRCYNGSSWNDLF